MSPVKSGPGGLMITGDSITHYRMLSQLATLKGELSGLRWRISVYAQVKREYGLKGSRQRVYDQFRAILLEAGLIKPDSKL